MLRRISQNALVIRTVDSYHQLERRDQIAMLSLGAFLLVVLLGFGVWQPLREFVDESLADRDSSEEMLQWMRGSEKRARSMTGTLKSPARSGQTLLTLVSQSARRAGIKANKLQPEGTDSVSVWFDSVSFNDLVRWLEKLEAEQSVQVHQISINRHDAPGMVNVRVVLKS